MVPRNLARKIGYGYPTAGILPECARFFDASDLDMFGREFLWLSESLQKVVDPSIKTQLAA